MRLWLCLAVASVLCVLQVTDGSVLNAFRTSRGTQHDRKERLSGRLFGSTKGTDTHGDAGLLLEADSLDSLESSENPAEEVIWDTLAARRRSEFQSWLTRSTGHLYTTGVVTWNMADSSLKPGEDELNRAALDALAAYLANNMHREGPDLVAVMLQECCAFEESVLYLQNAMNRNLRINKRGKIKDDEYEIVRSIAEGNWLFKKKGHCEAGVVVLARKFTQFGSSVLTTLRSGTLRTNKHTSPLKSDEKGLRGVWIKLSRDAGVSESSAGLTLCFAGAHLKPGKTLNDNGRFTQFNKYSTYLQDWSLHSNKLHSELDGFEGGCDLIFFGGDFNFHNADDWSSKKKDHVHEHYSEENYQQILSYMADWDIQRRHAMMQGGETNECTPYPWLDVEAVLESEHDHLSTLPPTPEFLMEKDERRLVNEVEDPGSGLRRTWQEAAMSPGRTGSFPTFQPIPYSKINPTGDPLGPSKGGKSQVFFPSTWGNYNPPNSEATKGFYLSASRPLCWTDAIMTWSRTRQHASRGSIQAFKISTLGYGPVIGEIESDHFPVLGLFSVRLNENMLPASKTETLPTRGLGNHRYHSSAMRMGSMHERKTTAWA